MSNTNPSRTVLPSAKHGPKKTCLTGTYSYMKHQNISYGLIWKLHVMARRPLMRFFYRPVVHTCKRRHFLWFSWNLFHTQLCYKHTCHILYIMYHVCLFQNELPTGWQIAWPPEVAASSLKLMLIWFLLVLDFVLKVYIYISL
jgi:hypothetical protein